VTTNDNVNAFRFYQRRDYCISFVDQGTVDRARRKKPSISLIRFHGIPIRDELTMVKYLDAVDSA
jgi:hypothetical protein